MSLCSDGVMEFSGKTLMTAIVLPTGKAWRLEVTQHLCRTLNSSVVVEGKAKVME